MARFVTQPGMFGYGTSQMSASARKWVANMGRRVGPARRVVCIGHADTTGTAKGNVRVALNRAQRVCSALGISKSVKVQVTGRGDHASASTNRTADGRAINRRVEVLVMYLSLIHI